MEEFVFTWKIENFFLSVNKKGNSISSPIFAVDSLEKTEWFLQMYPYGDGDENFIACYLNRSNSDGGPSTIAVSFTLSFVISDGSEQLLKKFEDQSFTLSQRVGCKDLKRKDDILKERKTVLPKGTLTIRCYMQISTSIPSISKSKDSVKSLVAYVYDEKANASAVNLPPEMYAAADDVLKEVKGKLCPYPENCTARTKIRMERKLFTWRIENFSELKVKERVSMPLISSSKLTPSLLLTFYLDDESVANQHIQIEIRKKADFTSAGIVTYGEISVLNDRGKLSESNNSVFFYEAAKNEAWLFPPIIKRSNLDSEKMVYLQNDVLSLFCEFTFSDGAILNQLEKTIYSETKFVNGDRSIENLINLRDDLHNLSMESKLCDVTLVVGETKFPAHRAVLSARSPVFKAMFERDMAEKESGVVKVSDLDLDTLKGMLEFMYGGEIGNLECESAAKLYSAADKYQFISLKNECSSLLQANLTIANVCDVLILANMHEDDDLKAAANDFILYHCVDTLRSEEWKTFMNNHTRLALETLHHVGLAYMEA